MLDHYRNTTEALGVSPLELHPAIAECLSRNWSPMSWADLVQEQPSLPREMDPSGKIAYTQRDKRVWGRLSKYVARHFGISGGKMDGILAWYENHLGPKDPAEPMDPHAGCQWIDTDQMIKHMVEIASKQDRPRSCMTKFSRAERHPYRVFLPSLGWRHAVRMVGEQCMARALVNGDGYVRSYTECPDNMYSKCHDITLDSWLETQGVERMSSWSGCEVSRIELDGGESLAVPYLDGDCRYGHSDGDVISIGHGNVDFSSTSGSTPSDNYEREIECISGETYPESEVIYIDYYLPEWAGDNRVSGYEHPDNMSRLGGEWYLDEHVESIRRLSGYARTYFIGELIQLPNGELAHNDDCAFIEEHDEWALLTDDVISDRYDNYQYREDCLSVDGYWILQRHLHSTSRGLMPRGQCTLTWDGYQECERDCVYLPGYGWCLRSEAVTWENGGIPQRVLDRTPPRDIPAFMPGFHSRISLTASGVSLV